MEDNVFLVLLKTIEVLSVLTIAIVNVLFLVIEYRKNKHNDKDN